MRKSRSLMTAVRILMALTFVVGSAVLLSSTDKPVFTEDQKAFYADASLINFVRPGLVVKIVSATAAPDGTVKVRFTLADPKGLPLDKDGITTPGTISTRFVVASIPKGQTQYVAYTTRVQTSPITKVSATQASTDGAGTFEKNADGDYTYTFATKLPAGYDKTATHTVGMWLARNLTEFELGTNVADAVYNWVPDGSKVVVVRDVIKTQTCNRCHMPISAHDERQSMDLCVLCHTPQSVDPDTGNTVDMPVMIHKIHMSDDLPSVKKGKPYVIIGYRQTAYDFSDVTFPSDRRSCTTCHEQNTGAAQKDNYLKPNRAACGACHDDVNFATGENHGNLPQVSDNQCATCHIPKGELEFDVSIQGAHQIPRFSSYLPGSVCEILAVDDGVAGKRPTVTFSLKDKSGAPILPSQMTRLALVLAGPTSDYASQITEDAVKATGTTDGRYFWTFQNPIPADAKGSFAVGIEGYRSVKIMAGTTKEQTIRDAVVNKVFYFSVDGSKVAPRRQVVALEKCNSCHTSLSLHGDNRNRIEQCVLCHNPNGTDADVRPASAGAAESIDLRSMVHRIHCGKECATYFNQPEYVIYGHRSSKNDFADVTYPGKLNKCDACHVNGSEQLPLADNLLPVMKPRSLVNPAGPESAACLACHLSVDASSHVVANTSKLGESCSVCHGRYSEFSVRKVHAVK